MSRSKRAAKAMRAETARAADPASRRRAYVLRESLKYDPTSNGALPKDIEVVRMALCRHLHTMLGDARRCPEPACKRTRRCAGPDMRCLRDAPPVTITEEESARARAEFRRAIDDEIARRGGVEP